MLKVLNNLSRISLFFLILIAISACNSQQQQQQQTQEIPQNDLKTIQKVTTQKQIEGLELLIDCVTNYNKTKQKYNIYMVDLEKYPDISFETIKGFGEQHKANYAGQKPEVEIINFFYMDKRVPNDELQAFCEAPDNNLYKINKDKIGSCLLQFTDAGVMSSCSFDKKPENIK